MNSNIAMFKLPKTAHAYICATILLIVFVGAGLRVAYFAIGRPVWVDEAALALNVVDKPWISLFGNLDEAFEYRHPPTSLNEVGMAANQTIPIVYLAQLKAGSDLSGGQPWGPV